VQAVLWWFQVQAQHHSLHLQAVRWWLPLQAQHHSLHLQAPCGGGSLCLCKHNTIRSRCRQCFPLVHEAVLLRAASRRDEAGQNATRTMLENHKPVAGVQVQTTGPGPSVGILGDMLGQ
jgi:hypothetical protein